MINCVKNGQEILLQDVESKMTLIIGKDNNQNININVRNDSQKFNSNYYCYANDFLITQSKIPYLFKVLDELYNLFAQKIMENPKRYIIKIDNEPYYYPLFKTTSGNKKELIYPSDDTAQVNYASSIGLIKYDNQNYIIRFHRSSRKAYNSKITLNKNNSRYPELYVLYDNLYRKLENLNITDYDKDIKIYRLIKQQ